jgi:hypothetical protein
MLRSVKDQFGHEIYLTDERWNHICEEHPEMYGFDDQVLETVQPVEDFRIRFVPTYSSIIRTTAFGIKTEAEEAIRVAVERVAEMKKYWAFMKKSRRSLKPGSVEKS